ncbi:hypothetical protein [Nocardia sp. SC052]|uniref:hypothetical protein n=1 Tax=Nocardia sichangensis TaxID=3385975 RepID=UPI0039A3518D
MTDTAVEFNQVHARVRDSLDALIEGMVAGQKACPSGQPVDSQRHTLPLVGYIMETYRPETLPMLLTEAVIRLAIAKGAR